MAGTDRREAGWPARVLKSGNREAALTVRLVYGLALR